MKQNDLVSRIWMDLTGLLMPLLAMAAYVLDWPPVVRTVLTILCLSGIWGTWIATRDLGSWRAERVARVRALSRRCRRRLSA
jgi:hypothetical protein